LETLAIIAYKQPITKSEIEAIRGVNCDYAVQRLLEKELVIITGRNENLPGKPLIYTTSKTFMDYFGINSADDLPKIKEVLAEQAVEATYLNKNTVTEQEASEQDNPADLLIDESNAEFLAVTPNGELVTAIEEESADAPESTGDDTDADGNEGAENEGEEKANPEE